jgi:hypothetical protein
MGTLTQLIPVLHHYTDKCTATSNVINEDVISTRPPGALLRRDARNSQVINEKEFSLISPAIQQSNDDASLDDSLYPSPTKTEALTLRKVAGNIPWVTWLLCLVEFAERASYYGAKQVFANFMQRPLPKGRFLPISEYVRN